MKLGSQLSAACFSANCAAIEAPRTQTQTKYELSAATADIEKTSRGSEFLFAKYYLDYLKLSEGSVTSRMIFKLTVMVEWVQNIFQYEVKFTVQYWGHAIEENLIP